MASEVFFNAYISLNAVVLSNNSNKVTITHSREELEDNTFGDTSKFYKPGLRNSEVTIEFYQDFADGEVDPTIWPLIDGDTAVPFEIRPKSSAVSTTNPKWTSSAAFVMSYNPVDGSHGTMLMTGIKLKMAKGGALTRATS